jgi:putative transposase
MRILITVAKTKKIRMFDMPWVAQKITLTEKQKNILEEIATSRTARVDHAARANIILHCANGLPNSAISQLVSLSENRISLWRNRWASYQEDLRLIEAETEKSIDYKRSIEGLLSDAPRSGAPGKFTAEQLCQIYAVATEKPEESGLPLSHWSLPALAEELVKRGIVESISTSQLSVFLKSAGAKAA